MVCFLSVFCEICLWNSSYAWKFFFQILPLRKSHIPFCESFSCGAWKCLTPGSNVHSVHFHFFHISILGWVCGLKSEVREGLKERNIVLFKIFCKTGMVFLSVFRNFKQRGEPFFSLLADGLYRGFGNGLVPPSSCSSSKSISSFWLSTHCAWTNSHRTFISAMISPRLVIHPYLMVPASKKTNLP